MSSKNIRLSTLNSPHTPTSSQSITHQSPVFSEKNKTQLGAVKFRRFLAEENVQLLNNKVLAYEHEHIKLLKTARDTEAKIALMLQRRIEREEDQREFREKTEKFKEMMRKTHEEKKMKVLGMNSMSREEQEEERKMKQQLMSAQRREQRDEILDRVHENREMMLIQNGQKVKKVRKDKVVSNRKLDDFCKYRLDYFAFERQRMIEEEERRIQEKEKLINSLSARGNKLADAVEEGHMKVKRIKEVFDEFKKLSTEEFLNKYPQYSKMVSPNQSMSKSFRIVKGKHFSSPHNKSKMSESVKRVNTYQSDREPNVVAEKESARNEEVKSEARVNTGSQEQNL